MFSPKAKVGSTKYGSKGLYTTDSFANTGLSLIWCQYLVEAANHSLSKETWSSYSTVRRHLEKCQNDLQIRFSFPMSADQTLVFTAWLCKRGLKGNTINSYLSGLRTIHLTKGIDQPALRPAVVTAVIKGCCHLDTIKRRLQNKPRQLPVTMNVLKLLKASLNNWDQLEELTF